MPYCDWEDVKLIIDTGMASGDIAGVITLADEEIDTRELTGAAWTANNLKRLSMLIAAEMLANNDTAARAVGDGTQVLGNPSKKYRQQAEDLIQRLSAQGGGEIAFVAYSEPEE